MSIRILKKGKQTEKLLRQMKQKYAVDVGHFEDQGMHYSGVTYPELMYHHHRGTGEGPGELPARPVRRILIYRVTQDRKRVFKGVSSIFKTAQYSENVQTWLKLVGERIAKMEKDIIGNPSILASNSPVTQGLKGGKNTPLEDSGDLKDKVEARIKKL